MVISESDLKSTREAAEDLGIHHITLQRHVASGKVPAPAVTTVGGVRVRLWNRDDIEKVRRILPTIANGRRHRKKAKKATKGKNRN
jgi:predicted site-specific integrase-resolvase